MLFGMLKIMAWNLFGCVKMFNFAPNLSTVTIKITNQSLCARMSENESKQQGLQLELPQDVAQGEYANLAIITHASSDFVIDFARVLPGVPKAQVKSRVILAPEHAKRLLAALQENIMRYEREFGPIRIPQQEQGGIAPFELTKGEA